MNWRLYKERLYKEMVRDALTACNSHGPDATKEVEKAKAKAKKAVSKQEAPKEDAPKKAAPKAEAPKSEVLKDVVPKEESRKDEVPKSETPNKEVPKKEAPTPPQEDAGKAIDKRLCALLKGEATHAAGLCRPCLFALRGTCRYIADMCSVCNADGHIWPL